MKHKWIKNIYIYILVCEVFLTLHFKSFLFKYLLIYPIFYQKIQYSIFGVNFPFSVQLGQDQ